MNGRQFELKEMGQHNNPSRPPARRVETDPAYLQQESSVRPVQEPTVPFTNAPQGTPPPRWRGPEDGQPSSYQPQQFESPGPPGEGDKNQQRREWRNSGWSRQNSGVTTGTA